jgi:hypothetical protein
MNFKQWIESLELMALRSHLKNPSIDIAGHGWDLLSWRGGKTLLKRLGVDPKKFQDSMEQGEEEFYTLAEKIGKSMSPTEQEGFLAYINQNNPGDVPTHSLMDLQSQKGRKGFLPPTTWLIHFSDDAEDVATDGLTKGQGDIDRLALTTHQGKAEKEYGGYNFAFIADSKYAAQTARTGKYGRNAVMFQASGIPVYHYSDEEDQVVVWGKDVSTEKMVFLSNDGGEWTVRSRKGGRDPITGDFKTVVAWVMKNYNQYRRVL